MATVLNRFTQGQATPLGTKLVLSGVNKIVITPFVGSAPGLNSYSLDSIIADSLTISQDDPETNSIECETSDTAIKTTVKEGSYHIEMTNADINKDILEECLGYTYSTSISQTGSSGASLNVAYAPESRTDRYVTIEIVFENQAVLVCPKVNLASKIDISSVKSEVVKATISGEMEIYNIGTTNNPINTPFFVIYPTVTA